MWDEQAERQIVWLAMSGAYAQRESVFRQITAPMLGAECGQVFKVCLDLWNTGEPFELPEVHATLKQHGMEMPLYFLENADLSFGNPQPIINRLMELHEKRVLTQTLIESQRRLNEESAFEVGQFIWQHLPGPLSADELIFRPEWNNRPPLVEPTITLNTHRIGSPGNLTLLVAGHGTGKSALCEALAAAKLSQSCDCFGLSVNTSRDVIYFDTERSKGDHWNSWSRTMRRADIPSGSQVNGVHFELLAMLQSAEQRRARLLRAIQEMKPGLVIIDGIGDFVLDVNEAIECNSWLYAIMALAKQNEFCIFATLHPNPNDTMNRKGRGHLGSEAMRRAESVLLLKKDEAGQRTLTMDFAHGKNRNGADNLETYLVWDEITQMFISCSDKRTGKPAARDRNDELIQKLAGRTYSFSELIETIGTITGKSMPACRGTYQRLKKKGLLVHDGQLWRVKAT